MYAWRREGLWQNHTESSAASAKRTDHERVLRFRPGKNLLGRSAERAEPNGVAVALMTGR